MVCSISRFDSQPQYCGHFSDSMNTDEDMEVMQNNANLKVKHEYPT